MHRSAKCYMTAENRSTRHGHHLSRTALANCSYGAAINWQEEIKLPHLLKTTIKANAGIATPRGTELSTATPQPYSPREQAGILCF